VNIVLVRFAECLLSSLYGFYDILDFARRKFGWDVELSLELPEQLAGMSSPWEGVPDVVFLPAFSQIEPVALTERYKSFTACLKELSARGTLVCSVCAGGFLLAASGLADGNEITTHWLYFDEMEKSYPAVKVNRSKILIDRGKYISGGGISSFQDLALYLIKRYISEDAARTTAKVFLINPEERSQLEYIIRNLNEGNWDERLDKTRAYMKEHIGDAVTLKDIAGSAGLSVRTLIRKFRSETGMTPAAWFRMLRIEHARTLLETSGYTIEDVAARAGYNDVSAFYRVFNASFGVAPGEYRNRYR
jgi:transcriptional regulator GlxA family with amidase domain